VAGGQPTAKQVQEAVEEVKAEVPPKEPDQVLPARLVPVFNRVPLMQQAVQALRRAFTPLSKVEQADWFVRDHKRSVCGVLETRAREIEAVTPAKPCPEGCGEHEPSKDSDRCKVCGGKGYLTQEECGDDQA
jgi:hypothetical protein